MQGNELIHALMPKGPVPDLPLTRRAADVAVPLAPFQLTLWNLYTSTANGLRLHDRVCNIALHIAGPLDPYLLQIAVRAVVERHESLRTTIVTMQGVPQQRINTPRDCYLDTIDLSRVRRSACEQEVQRLLCEFTEEKIDLSVGPLFAARLFRLANDDHVLVLAADHMIMDGISMEILNREIWTTYHGTFQGLTVSLPLLEIQYGDFSVWQHKTLDWWRVKHEAYWVRRLDGAPNLRLSLSDTATEGPIDRLSIPFGPTLTEELRTIARREGMLLAIVVFALYVAVMSRCYGEQDLLVKLSSSGRYRPELRDMVGLVTYPSYLRIEMHGDDSFLDLLRLANSEFLAANKHRDFGWVRQLVQTPSTDLAFNWGPGWTAGNSPGMIEGSGIRMRPFWFDRRLSGVKFMAAFSETVTGVVMSVIYRPSAIAPHAVRSLGNTLLSMANEFVRRPLARFTSVLRDVSPGLWRPR
jgi:hypothetical protein